MVQGLGVRVCGLGFMSEVSNLGYEVLPLVVRGFRLLGVLDYSGFWTVRGFGLFVVLCCSGFWFVRGFDLFGVLACSGF